jgi:hypothetical protein
MTTLGERLVKIGAKIVRHGRSISPLSDAALGRSGTTAS